MSRKGKGGPAGAQALDEPPHQQPAAHEPQPPQGGGRSKPAHEVRAGRIKADVWLNEDNDDRPWFSVVLSRSYKDGEGNWKQATSFGRDDLLVVAECARLAWLYCSQQSASPNGHSNGNTNGHVEEKSEDIPF